MNIIEQLLDNVPCRCDENDPIVKLFHHVDPNDKTVNIGEWGVGHHSIPRLIKEFEKCEILCANCHVREHKLQGGYRYAKIRGNKEGVK